MNNSLKINALGTEDFIGKPLPTIDVKDFDTYIEDHSFDINKLPDENDKIIFYEEDAIGSSGNIISITGKAKSRKTVIASALITAMLLGAVKSFLKFTANIRGRAIVHIDTEQGYGHYYDSILRMIKNAGLEIPPQNFHSIHTRDAEIEFMIELVEYYIEKVQPGVLILDGAADFVYDFNDQKEARKFVRKLLKWSTQYKMVVIAIIHTTKTTGFMTGALGTALEKQSETVIKVEKDEKDESFSHVSCQYSRNKKFPDFTIQFDEQKGEYVVVNEPEIHTKGKGGNKFPEGYHEDIHTSIITQLFIVRSAYNAHELRLSIIAKVKQATNDDIGSKMATKWIEYYNQRTLIYQDPDSATWMRTGAPVAQTSLFHNNTQADDENVMPGDNPDELPF